jgi:nucleoside-diphosphate-sugar epimerase
VNVAVGDALDADAVARAVAGADAVVSALGPISNRREEVDAAVVGIRNILSAMRVHGVRRLVALNGAAVTMPGERKPLGGRIASALVRLFVRNVVEAKQREVEEIAASDLDWTIVRPPRVTDTPPAGRAVPGDRLHSRRISEVDLAAFMVSELDAREYVRRAPFVSG